MFYDAYKSKFLSGNICAKDNVRYRRDIALLDTIRNAVESVHFKTSLAIYICDSSRNNNNYWNDLRFLRRFTKKTNLVFIFTILMSFCNLVLFFSTYYC